VTLSQDVLVSVYIFVRRRWRYEPPWCGSTDILATPETTRADAGAGVGLRTFQRRALSLSERIKPEILKH
jgi:hypothetical protein